MTNMIPRFEIEPLAAEDGGGYLIRYPDFPGCIADGETPEEAMDAGKDALKSYIETLKELGRPIPKAGDESFSGKWSQRAPRSLHASLTRLAADEGVSFNSLCIALLAEGIGRRTKHQSKGAASQPPSTASGQ